jgi:ferredoxin
MIVAERKPVDEVYEFVKDYKNVLVVGCKGCVTIHPAGGEKEVGILSTALRMTSILKKKKTEIVISQTTIERQCEKEWVKEISNLVDDADVVVSMACGAGVQLFAEIYQTKPVFPGVNTKFIGITETQGQWSERCAACGNCILHITGGICPIARCSKSLLNGPCGGSQNGKCEINENVECGWQLIYDRLKMLNKLHMLNEIVPIKDWSTSSHGGPRKVVRDDMFIEPKQ